jgi:hypothetical protein
MSDDPIHIKLVARRTFLERLGSIGGIALASLLDPSLLKPARLHGATGQATVDDPARADHWRGVVNPRHLQPKIRRVIHLYMAGGPSQFETLDHKPKLAELHDQPMPESFTKGQPIAQLQNQKLLCFGPQYPFSRYGQSGQEICALFPHLGSVADQLCILRSMTTDAINHDPAHTLMNTGTTIPGRASMGSWLLYGLGSESENLPGFVVLSSEGKGGEAQPIASRQWHSGFLPSRFQGVEFRSTGEPVLYVGNPPGVDRGRQRQVVDAVQSLNRLHNRVADDPEIATRIAQYEMAFQMQASVPELVDVSDESPETLALYGTSGDDGSFAANCLLARRMAERGTRFIQLYHRAWDHHGAIKKSMAITAKEVDQASAALLIDLQQRGMLEDTLVVWGGEFGRTPMAQPRPNGRGRDHHIKGFSLWLAGGGIRGGMTYGATDELGYNAAENVLHVRDLHATILHLLGIDHERLSYPSQGLDMRLTGVEPSRVVHEILT